MRRGEATKRLDANYNKPEYRLNERNLIAVWPDARRLDFYANVVCGPFGTEITSKDYKDTGVPLLRISNITNEGTIDETDLVFLSEEKAESLRSTQVKSGDVVISQRGTLGIPAIVPDSYPVWNISANLIAIKKLKEISGSFVQFYLSTKVGGKQVERCQSGQVQGKITTEDIASIIIPKTPRENQLVADLEAAREARKRKLAETDALLAGLDGFLLEQLGLATLEEDNRQVFAVRLKQVRNRRIDASSYRPYFKSGVQITTPLKSLGDIADIDSNPTTPPSNDETLVPYVGLPECYLNEVREVVLRPYKEVRGRSVVKPGDILFARIEPSVFNRKYVLADDLKGHDQAYTSTEFYVVRSKEAVVEQGYLYAMFFCSFVFTQVKGKTTGSSGRRRIDPEMFASLQIPLPDMALQKSIAAEITRRRDEARRLRAEAAKEWEAAKAEFERQLLGK